MLFIYCVVLSIFVIWTILNGLFLPRIKKGHGENLDRISILIPMRNEQRNVKQCISMLKQLTYPQLEFIIYNDQSTDLTGQMLYQEIEGDARFRVIEGVELPSNWVGKVHACHQLQRVATGKYLAFIDADVTLSSHIFEKVVPLMRENKIGLITGFPHFMYSNWLDRLVLPMMHFLVNFHLPVALANYTKWPAATAANGTFLFFEREAYEKMGGHLVVKNSLLEDVEIARAMKKSGMRVLLVNLSKDSSCKMYTSAFETWQGFSKNTFNGLNYSFRNAVLFVLFYSVTYVFPLVLLINSIVFSNWLYAIPYILIVIQRMVSDFKSKTPLYYALFMPLSSLAMLIILCNSIYLYQTKRSYVWKGREYG